MPFSNVRHPNIVACYGVFVDDDNTQYMVTDWMENGDLKTFLDKNQQKISYLDMIRM
jgi:serine/threonine protein kinase